MTASESGDAPPHPSTGIAPNLEQPSLFWRTASQATLLGTATLCRLFLYGLNKTEVHGFPAFYELLRSRDDPTKRERGLLTVSNHVSVMDDPIIWGTLPLSGHRFGAPQRIRWGFGSHDICFTAAFRSQFFTLGQVLPTHRSAHSQFGGPYQYTMTEAIRLLSPIQAPLAFKRSGRRCPIRHVDPFSDLPLAPHYPSYPADERNYLAPSRYASNNFAWVHIFPEGMIHQSENYDMRYFKWGIARLILEPPVCPDVVPMWIEGTDQVMHESREFPRFIPRAFKRISVTFGAKVDTDARFGDLRARWEGLERRSKGVKDANPSSTISFLRPGSGSSLFSFSSLKSLLWRIPLTPAGTTLASNSTQSDRSTEPTSEQAEQNHLNIGLPLPNLDKTPRLQQEIEALWEETAFRVREEVLKLRRARGWPDEDPKASAAETWAREGKVVEERKASGIRSGREGGKAKRMEDGSWVGGP
ncbi:Lysophosphatidylcholine acyltransferase [Cyphellophora attinorum]|uniref:Lysophosphatidylcholine acyltransferase n=1 Tax=Cyphellophora attinorum TaxID=1664694 RepID=A0A0N1HSQ7_9EURO|nr:Lysophosphatidylcholine acyltransferase [Phialophora attinorum]KPI39316.1 Lysophosphatidylcholine acyltransferase [Phialophora attinorum]